MFPFNNFFSVLSTEFPTFCPHNNDTKSSNSRIHVCQVLWHHNGTSDSAITTRNSFICGELWRVQNEVLQLPPPTSSATIVANHAWVGLTPLQFPRNRAFAMQQNGILRIVCTATLDVRKAYRLTTDRVPTLTVQKDLAPTAQPTYVYSVSVTKISLLMLGNNPCLLRDPHKTRRYLVCRTYNF
jgi:hypothetical protein